MSEQRALLDINRRLELALDASGIGIWEHNATTGAISWDDRLRDLYGLDRGAAPIWIELVHPEDRDAAAAEFAAALDSHSNYQSRFRIIRTDGAVRHLCSRGHYHHNANGDIVMVGAEWDVTLDVMREQELQHRTAELDRLRLDAERAASTDPLTGLANRRALDRFILEDGLRPGPTCRAVLHIDLDDFKTINDGYGHEVGDEHLRRFAHGLSAIAPAGAVLTRSGGDEFLVFLPQASTASAALLATAVIALAASLSRMIDIGLGSASVGISLGLAGWRQQIKDSDDALYAAKRGGRGRFQMADDRPDALAFGQAF